MTRIRIALAALLAAGALVAGGAVAQQHASVSVSHVEAGPVPCCFSAVDKV